VGLVTALTVGEGVPLPVMRLVTVAGLTPLTAVEGTPLPFVGLTIVAGLTRGAIMDSPWRPCQIKGKKVAWWPTGGWNNYIA